MVEIPTSSAGGSQNDLGCSSLSTGQGWGSCITSLVYYIGPGLASNVAYVGAYFFSYTVSLSLNSVAYALDFLSWGWTTVRDLANMAFILILVYLAFIIMFRAETARTLQFLAWVIFIALIINFSFFLTRVVIDAGNILAVQFYNAIPYSATLSGTNNLVGFAGSGVKDLSHSIMQAVGLQSLFSSGSFGEVIKASGGSVLGAMITLTVVFVALAVMFWILFFIFLHVGVKFLMRIVVLWFLIMAAPLALVARAVPSPAANVYYLRWQTMLLHYSFYPAIFLFIYLILVRFLQQMMAGQSGNLMSTLFSQNAATNDPTQVANLGVASAIANVSIRMGFVVAIFYIALKASDWIAGEGSQIANNIAGKITRGTVGSAASLISRPIGFAGRRVFSGAGNAVANNAFINRAAGNPNIGMVNRGIFKGLRRAGAYVGTASYDPRNAPGGSIIKKGVDNLLGPTVNVGKPHEGGRVAELKAKEEERKKYDEAMRAIKRDDDIKTLIADLAKKGEDRGKLETTAKTRVLTPAENTQKTVLDAQIAKLSGKLNGLGKPAIETLKTKDIEKVLKHAKEGFIKKIQESDKFSENDKDKLRDKWEDASLEASQSIIKQLQVIHSDLITRGRAGAPAGTLALPTLNTTTTTGTLIDSDQLKTLLTETKTELQNAKSRLNVATAAGSAPDIDRERENIRALQAARDHVTDLERTRKVIPDGKGGAPKAEEFLVA